MEVLGAMGRTAILWAVALAVFRMMGKRTLGKMGPFDFAVVIMIGEAVALGMENGHGALVRATAVTVVLGVLQWGLTWLNYRWRWLEKLTQGMPTPVVSDGKVDTQKLKAERLSKADLLMELRQNQVKLSDIKEARLEPSGKVSFTKKQATATKASSGKKDSAQSGQGNHGSS